MADAHLGDFYGRIHRIRKNYRSGGGFEAAGTLGRAYFVPPPPVHVVPTGRILRAGLYTLVAVTVLKALILANIGPTAYANRIATLQRGDAIARIGAVLMTADPATSFLATEIAAVSASQS